MKASTNVAIELVGRRVSAYSGVPVTFERVLSWSFLEVHKQRDISIAKGLCAVVKGGEEKKLRGMRGEKFLRLRCAMAGSRYLRAMNAQRYTRMRRRSSAQG